MAETGRGTFPFVLAKSGEHSPLVGTVEERKAAYEKSGLKQLMDAAEHEICEHCFCCDVIYETVPCGVCGGFEPEYDESDWPEPDCFHCGGEGEITVKKCIGNCQRIEDYFND